MTRTTLQKNHRTLLSERSKFSSRSVRIVLVSLLAFRDFALSELAIRLNLGFGQIAILLALHLTILGAVGCGSGSAGASTAPTLSSRFVMPVDRLPRALKHKGVVLLSVQGFDDGEISNPGFVNNAVPVDELPLKLLSESSDAFTNFSAWAQIFGELGVSNDSEVILYDDGEMKFASRVRFLLYYFGVRRTFIVNGGYNAMEPLIEDGRLTQTPAGVPTSAIFEVKVQNNPIHLVNRDDVFAVLGDPAVTLVDVRTVGEFDGCDLLPGITRGGHIPGARNLPIENLLTPQTSDPDFFLLASPPDLRSIFRNFGLHTHDRIIAYCHDGAKSSLAAVSLIDAGYQDVSLYYLSYLDWQEDPSDPVESVSPCS
jgi:thiosulfate/3-mercaptopyruvate sulfurtransferase